MSHFVVVSVNTLRGQAHTRFEAEVNEHLANGYKFVGPPQSDGAVWVAFMLKEEDSA